MDKNKLQYFKEMLKKERNKVIDTIDLMKDNGMEIGQRENTQELSMVDNHPADVATEMFDKERQYALYDRQNGILKDIDDSMKRIDNGTYGKCIECGKDISTERLEFLPYADKCIQCEKRGANNYTNTNDRPVEESVLKYPFGRSFRDVADEVEYDGEDTWQDVYMPNRREEMEDNYDDEYDEGIVEPIDNISNQQYKNQLP